MFPTEVVFALGVITGSVATGALALFVFALWTVANGLDHEGYRRAARTGLWARALAQLQERRAVRRAARRQVEMEDDMADIRSQR